MRKRLNYANVVSSLAVFLALGGVSYAAVKLPKNSVTAKHIKAGAVGSPEVKDGGLAAVDFGAVPTVKGARGDAGPPGAPGPAGDPGPKGEVGPTCADLRCSTSDLDGVARLTADGNQLGGDLLGFQTSCEARCSLLVAGSAAQTRALRDWAAETPPTKRSMSLTVYSHGGDPVQRWHLTDGFPISVDRVGGRVIVRFATDFLQRVAV